VKHIKGKTDMKSLTNKEEEIMDRYWDFGPMHIKELQSHYQEPQPHVNTLSTLVHILEEKGFLGHKALTARCFQYFATITRDEYRHGTLNNVVNKFFGKSYLNAVSALVKDEKISVEELKELINKVEGKQ
jgi:BlaI family penicillinase repressor